MPWPGYFRIDYDQRFLGRQAGAQEALAEHGHRLAVRHIGRGWAGAQLPVMGTYATFAAARNLDQIPTSVCYGNFDVLIAGARGGVSVGPDGATHQALEDLFAMQGLPNMSVVVPGDAVETRKATTCLLLLHKGPKYIRLAGEATPVVTSDATPFVFGASERDPSAARGA